MRAIGTMILHKDNSKAKEIVKWLAIIVTTAYAYNIAPSFEINGLTFNLNNMVRVFFLIHPASVIGVGIGAQIDAATKIAVNPLYAIMPTVHALIFYAAWQISKKWGRSTIKDFALIIVFGGIIHGVLTTLNSALSNYLVFGTARFWQSLDTLTFDAVVIMSLKKIFTISLGYPLVKMVDRYKRMDAKNYSEVKK